MELPEEEALADDEREGHGHAGSNMQARRGGNPSRRNPKRNIADRKPLPAGLQTAAAAAPRRPGSFQFTASSDARALSQALAGLRALPRNSLYARQRIKMMEKALELLGLKRRQRTAEQAQELSQLLLQLNV